MRSDAHLNSSGTSFSSGTSGYVDEAFEYTGRWFDSGSGLQNNLNRWYDSSIGRWISQDPIGFNGDPSNLYRYVGNEATNSTDPGGLVDPRQFWQVGSDGKRHPPHQELDS